MCLVLVCASQFFTRVIVQRRLVVMEHIERDEDGLEYVHGRCGGVLCLAVSAYRHGRCARAHDPAYAVERLVGTRWRMVMCLVLVCVSQCFAEVIFQRRLVVMGHIERRGWTGVRAWALRRRACLGSCLHHGCDARALTMLAYVVERLLAPV